MLLQTKFESVEQMNPLFERVDGELLQTAPGPQDWEIAHAALPSGGASHIKCGAPITGHGATSENDVAFLVPWQQRAPHKFLGIDMAADGFSVYGPGTAHVGRVQSESEITMLVFSADRVAASFNSLAGTPGAGMPIGFQAINPPAGSRQRFNDYLSTMFTQARRDSEFLGNPAVLSEIEGRLLEIACVTAAHLGTHAQRQPLRCRNRTRVVKRSWEIVNQNRQSPVSLEMLCSENNVSLRTLEYAFLEIAGINPNLFLRIHRLHISRGAMVRGEARFVKEAAYAGGFFHLGRFSVDYREVFGESPVQTLRRIHGRTYAAASRPAKSILG
jgi:AraC-like DNA-binding protein